SGQVTFAPDGNPVHKSILVVCAAVSTSTNSSPSGPTFHLAEISGQFLQGETVQTQGKLSEECR
ncbi:MAG TPA: hypothetical protein VFA10_29285, partial [Ktedonobacteraceae bacterium]|nr:hypothetical protein [Ktedonobacteraceae bacterium]